MRVGSLAWLGGFFILLGCGRNAEPPANPGPPTKPKTPIIDPLKPTRPADVAKPKPTRKSAVACAGEYLHLFKNGPVLKEGNVLLPDRPLPSETKACYRRRIKASADRPLYSYSSWKLTPVAEKPDQNRIAFHGKANVTYRYNPLNKDRSAGQFSWGVPTGGAAAFTLELVRADARADWRVDDFRFERRKPQAGPAALQKEEYNRVVHGGFGFPDWVMKKFKLDELMQKLDRRAWVYYYVGGPVEFRLTAQETGQRTFEDPWKLEADDAKFKQGEETRLLVMIGRDLRNDGTFRPTETVIVTTNTNCARGRKVIDLPCLWYHWKGADLKVRESAAELVEGKETTLLEIEATELKPAAKAQPRKVILKLTAKRSAKK
jgi:hypothetical protein